jgi:hypothetical protein
MKARPHLIPALVAAGILFGALADLPYGYYQMLRWIVFGVSIYIAYKAFRWDKKWAIWVFSGSAVLFNPILPIYLTREIWQPLDVIFGTLFMLSIVFLKEPAKTISSDQVETHLSKDDKRQEPSMKSCSNCGYVLSPGINYCPQCGQKIRS